MKRISGRQSAPKTYIQQPNFPQNSYPSKLNYQPVRPIKISVKSPQSLISQKDPRQTSRQFQSHHQINQIPYSFQKLNQTQLTNVGTVSHHHKPGNENPSNISLGSSVIEQGREQTIKSDIHNSRSFHSLEPRRFTTMYESSKLKIQESPTLQSPPYTYYNESALVQSYSKLLKQNMELKRIIDEEYKPLKQIYQKLKEEHEDREYLVSQLEWKVKQLALEIKNKKF